MKTNGRVVALTGADGRLGRLLAQALAASGDTVAAVVRPPATGRKDLPASSPSDFFTADLADENEVERCFRNILSRHGRIDALIHAAGSWDSQPLLQTGLRDWRRLLDSNLTSAFLCVRETVRAMQGTGGRIILFSSAQGADQGRAMQAPYGAAKAGIIRLAESVTAEFGASGIRCWVVAPSTILYGAEASEAVSAASVVALCSRLLTQSEEPPNGSVIRLYRDP